MFVGCTGIAGNTIPPRDTNDCALLNAELAAREMTQVPLEDALALVVPYGEQGEPRSSGPPRQLKMAGCSSRSRSTPVTLTLIDKLWVVEEIDAWAKEIDGPVIVGLPAGIIALSALADDLRTAERRLPLPLMKTTTGEHQQRF